MTDGQNYVLDGNNPPNDLNGFNVSVFNAYGYASYANAPSRISPVSLLCHRT